MFEILLLKFFFNGKRVFAGIGIARIGKESYTFLEGNVLSLAVGGRLYAHCTALNQWSHYD